MKIALVTDTFEELNGVARTYQRFAKFCREKNITLEIFTPGVARSEETNGSVKIQRFRAARPLPYYRELPPFDLNIFSPGFRETFDPKQFDTIHLATPGSLGIAARLLIKKQTPSVGVYHTLLDCYAEHLVRNKMYAPLNYFTAPIARTISRKALNWFYRGCEIILAPSQNTKKELETLGRPLDLFPRGVDTELFNPKHADQTLAQEKPIALYVGRLSSEKNLVLLASLWRNRTDCDLWIVGDGPQRKYLQHHIPHAKFFGALTGNDLSRAYASADFFIFPSTTDTFGNAVLEALASGLPAIVTNVGGPQELITNGVTGFVVAPTNQAFDEAIKKMSGNKKLIQTMSHAGRSIAEKRDWDSAFYRLLELYKTTCNISPNHPST